LWISGFPAESDIIEAVLNKEGSDEGNVCAEDNSYEIQTDLIANPRCLGDTNWSFWKHWHFQWCS
jgi:hypothetical protein